MKNIIYSIICLVIAVLIFIGTMYQYIIFERNCSGHLKNAACANNVELAAKELNKALNYIEKNDLTHGYTSILYKTPDEDIGFWYSNIKLSYNELISVSNETTSLEKSNILLKLRETLIDEVDGTTIVTYPDGIQKYPNNVLYNILLVIAYIFVILSMWYFILWCCS